MELDFELIKKYNKYLNTFSTKIPKKQLRYYLIQEHFYTHILPKPHLLEVVSLEKRKYMSVEELPSELESLLKLDLGEYVKKHIENNELKKKKYLSSGTIKKKRYYLDKKIKDNELKVEKEKI